METPLVCFSQVPSDFVETAGGTKVFFVVKMPVSASSIIVLKSSLLFESIRADFLMVAN